MSSIAEDHTHEEQGSGEVPEPQVEDAPVEEQTNPTTRVPIPLPPSPPPPHPHLIVRSVAGLVITVLLIVVAWAGLMFTAYEPFGPTTVTDPTSGRTIRPKIQVLRPNGVAITSGWNNLEDTVGYKPLVDPKVDAVIATSVFASDEQLVVVYCQDVQTDERIPQEDCHNAFPKGFDITVMVSGTVLALTRASISSEPSFVAADLPSTISSSNVTVPRTLVVDSFAPTNYGQSKTCRNAIDECIVASLQQTTHSYDMVPDYHDRQRYSRMLFTMSAASPMEMHRVLVITSPTEMFTLTVLVNAARISTTYAYRFVLLLVLLALVPMSLVAVKLLGKVVSARHPTFRPPVVPPSHQDVVDEAWEEVLITTQRVRASLEDTVAWVRSVGWRLPALVWFRFSALLKRIVRAMFCCRAEEPLLEGAGHRRRGGDKSFQRMSSAEEMGDDAALTNSDEEGDICRICRVGDPVSDLIAPCACNGSSKFIHRDCLNRWRTLTTNPEHQRICAECKTPYQLEFVQDLTEADGGTIERAGRAAWSRLRSVLSLIVGITVCIGSTFAFGYAILGLTAIIGLDPNVRFDAWDQAFSIGASNAATILVVYVRGLPFVTDFPSTLAQRIPALYVLSVVSPLILGYAIRVAVSLMFKCILTPTVSFRLGAIVFYMCGSLVGSLALTTMEMCGDQVAGTNNHSYSDDDDDDHIHEEDAQEDAHEEVEEVVEEQPAQEEEGTPAPSVTA